MDATAGSRTGFSARGRYWVSTGVNASVSASVYTSVLTSVYFVFVTGGWALASDISAGNAPPGFMASGFTVGDVSASVIVCGNVPVVVAGGGCVVDGCAAGH